MLFDGFGWFWRYIVSIIVFFRTIFVGFPCFELHAVRSATAWPGQYITGMLQHELFGEAEWEQRVRGILSLLVKQMWIQSCSSFWCEGVILPKVEIWYVPVCHVPTELGWWVDCSARNCSMHRLTAAVFWSAVIFEAKGVSLMWSSLNDFGFLKIQGKYCPNPSWVCLGLVSL